MVVTSAKLAEDYRKGNFYVSTRGRRKVAQNDMSVKIRVLKVTNRTIVLSPEADDGNASALVGVFVHLDIRVGMNGEELLKADTTTGVILASKPWGA
jgi:hypothetical protein